MGVTPVLPQIFRPGFTLRWQWRSLPFLLQYTSHTVPPKSMHGLLFYLRLLGCPLAAYDERVSAWGSAECS